MKFEGLLRKSTRQQRIAAGTTLGVLIAAGLFYTGVLYGDAHPTGGRVRNSYSTAATEYNYATPNPQEYGQNGSLSPYGIPNLYNLLQPGGVSPVVPNQSSGSSQSGTL